MAHILAARRVRQVVSTCAADARSSCDRRSCTVPVLKMSHTGLARGCVVLVRALGYVFWE